MLSEKMLAHCAERVRIERQKASNTSDLMMRNVALTHADTVELIANELREIVEAEVRAEAQEPVGLIKNCRTCIFDPPPDTCVVSLNCEGCGNYTKWVSNRADAAPQPLAPCPDLDAYHDVCQRRYAERCTERDALLAKVAEQSAEIERQNSAYEALDEQRNRDFETIAQQAALIEQCEKALINHRYLTRPINETDEAISAIDAHRGQS